MGQRSPLITMHPNCHSVSLTDSDKVPLACLSPTNPRVTKCEWVRQKRVNCMNESPSQQCNRKFTLGLLFGEIQSIVVEKTWRLGLCPWWQQPMAQLVTSWPW